MPLIYDIDELLKNDGYDFLLEMNEIFPWIDSDRDEELFAQEKIVRDCAVFLVKNDGFVPMIDNANFDYLERAWIASKEIKHCALTCGLSDLFSLFNDFNFPSGGDEQREEHLMNLSSAEKDRFSSMLQIIENKYFGDESENDLWFAPWEDEVKNYVLENIDVFRQRNK